MTGKRTDTATSQLLQMAGMPQQTANFIDTGISVVGSISGIAASRATETLIPHFQLPKNYTTRTPCTLNRFDHAASNLSETGKNNIRILRNWAKSKGWEKELDPLGGPEKWGLYDENNKLIWHLKLKPEASFRSGLKEESNILRFDARLPEGFYINPFTNEIGNSGIGSHLPLEFKYYE